MKLSEEAREFLKKNKINDYTLNSDGTIDVKKGVEIITIQSTLPVKFGKVSSYFSCSGSKLTSLVGCPSYVVGNFYCTHNNLTSLEGAPNYVGCSFYCQFNRLTSLHDIHKHIKELNVMFYCHNNPIRASMLGLLMIKGIRAVLLDHYEVEKILNKYIGKGRAGVIDAQQELLDVGLDDYARL